VDYETAKKYPELYKGLQKGRELCTKTIAMWVFQTVYQGFVVMIIVLWANLEQLEMQTTAFTSLVFILLFNVINEMSRWNRLMVATVLFSMMTYVATITLMPWYLGVSAMTFKHYSIVALSVFVAWLPLYLTNYVMFSYYPTEDQKLMRQVSSKRFGDSYMKIICGLIICCKKKDQSDIKKEFELQDFN
jgi:magnesium-transporting ATPase (P-type)